MTLDSIKNLLPDYAKDLKLNLSSVLTPAGAPGLAEQEIHAIAVATAFAARHAGLAQALEAAAGEHLDADRRRALRAAVAIMGMNNIYYRFTHLVADEEYQTMPARLRMNILANPGVSKREFELLSLAVSAVNGCGACVDSHEKTLRGAGVERQAVQSAVRIAAVVHAVAGILAMEDVSFDKEAVAEAA